MARKAKAAKPAKRVRIHLQDQGQDFLWLDLERCDDGDYRAVDCGPFQARMWTGYFVARNSVRKGRKPLIAKDNEDYSSLKYPITRVERLKSTPHPDTAVSP
jgi:hypothetical protein